MGSRPYPNRNQRTRVALPRRKKRGGKPGVLLVILLVLIAAVVAVLVFKPQKQVEEDTKPHLATPKIASSVTVGSTGDILIHSPIYEAAYINGQYDFSRHFALIAPYYQKPDLMVCNFEVTCAGEDYGYSSYPRFSCPDNIATTLAASGVDICLTANNHSNDSGKDGLLRTIDVIRENGMEVMGTRKSADDHYMLTKMVNGIKLGMVCYTYDTREITGGQISLNGLPLYDGADQLVNTYNYNDLEDFYRRVQQDFDHMKMLGVEANIVYMHWGNEYWDDPSDTQEEMARRLNEMGADVIIGGHPHVIERYETLTNSKGHETLCLYSTGNEISNQRAHYMDEDAHRGYTEDGIIFNVTFSKFNNGKVKVTAIDALPTWVDLTNDAYGLVYSIVPCDNEKDPSTWGASSQNAAVASYNRTMGRISENYNNFRQHLRLSPDPTF